MFQDSVPAGSYNDPFLSSVCQFVLLPLPVTAVQDTSQLQSMILPRQAVSLCRNELGEMSRITYHPLWVFFVFLVWSLCGQVKWAVGVIDFQLTHLKVFRWKTVEELTFKILKRLDLPWVALLCISSYALHFPHIHADIAKTNPYKSCVCKILMAVLLDLKVRACGCQRCNKSRRSI